MTMFDNDIERFFDRMTRNMFNNMGGSGYHGYVISTGPNGYPVVKEIYDPQQPLEAKNDEVDTIYDEKTNTIKMVVEMPGVEKSDIKINVDNRVVHIYAEREGKKYDIKTNIDKNIKETSANASYRNGILEIVFPVIEEKQSGHAINVN